MTESTPAASGLSPILGDACNKAIEYHLAGELEAAESVYRAVLQAEQRHPVANYHLGLLLFQVQQGAAALPFLLMALEVSPETADYWLAYIEALIQVGQMESAQEALVLGQEHGLAGGAVDALAARLKASLPEAQSARAVVTSLSPVPASDNPVSGKKGRPSPRDEVALIALFDQGHYSEGVALARMMTKRFPRHSFGWKILGALLRAQGHSTEALGAMRKSLQMAPQDAQAHSNLGLVLSDLNRHAEAEACHRRALVINPQFADGHNNLGSALKFQGHLADAEVCFRKAVALMPRHAEAYNNLGVTLYDQGRFAEAEAAYVQALAISPEYAEAHNNLANALRRQFRPAEAVSCLQRALACRPDFANAHYNLAGALRDLGRLDEAVESFQQALVLRPDFAEAQLNLGATFSEQGCLNEAECCYLAALVLNPEYGAAHNNLGVLLRQLGRLPEAEACFRQALTINPDDTEVYSNLLFNHCGSPDATISYCLEEARQFGRLLDRMTGKRFSRWSCAMQPSRLRVGLISGDLRNHAVGHWLESVLCHIDPARIELIAYPTHLQMDELSARVAPFFSAWKSLADCRDEDAARMIHADGVHVLIDASGHTAGNRLPIFAWKPAPVQMTWLGYFATTGVKEIDYLLGDPFVTPEVEEGHFTEKIWRLPDSYLCFTPPRVALEVNSLPALTVGCFTFGCFNNLAKMTDEVVSLWARILQAVPRSRLFLKTRQLNDHGICTITCQRFASHGIAADRLILEGGAPRAELLAAYQRVDMALDPFPYPGGTTSVEAIWMGVPIITRCGDRFLSHLGECIASNAGLADWVAVNNDDYVARAVGFAANLEQLAVLRANLRQQALASPLFNAPQFVRNFEGALWGMWQQWETDQGALQ